MSQDLDLSRLRTGLTVKLWAMWVLLAALLVPLVIPSELGFFLAIATPLTIDFAGRLLSANPSPNPWRIRLSIAAQLFGIGSLLACFTLIPNQVIGSINIPIGVFAGTVLAAIWQAVSAKLFVTHLQALAQVIDRPDLIQNLSILSKNLFRTTFAFYGVGIISIVVILAAVFFGMVAYVIGLIVTLPLAFLFLLPLWMTCMVFYFLMLYSYQSALKEFRSAISS